MISLCLEYTCDFFSDEVVIALASMRILKVAVERNNFDRETFISADIGALLRIDCWSELTQLHFRMNNIEGTNMLAGQTLSKLGRHRS